MALAVRGRNKKRRMLFMGMLGSQEILLILVAIILLFGDSRLPELARSMGRSMGEFRRELQAARDGGGAIANMDIALTRAQRMAMNLGIDTSGKTEEQLLTEIEKKIGK
jgi:sec-independent protein translocase protein TatA